MASQGSASDARTKSRLPQYGARQTGTGARDKPLFTSMRRPQFQQDFTTESLNNTGIGSPSPVRSFYAAPQRTEPPARGTTLAAAFRRVDEQDKNEENKEQSTTNQTTSALPARPALTRQYVTEAPRPAEKVVSSRDRTRTPSPPRGRRLDSMLSPMSEVSESSPPREFAEAYKQINDAEDLAAQEDEQDITDETDGVLEDEDLLKVGRQSSRRSSRRRSPGEDDAIILDSPEKLLPDTTQDSVPSLPSDLELEAGNLSRYQKDLQRLDLAIGEPKAFSKARRRPKLVGDNAKHDTNSRSGSHSEHSNTSGSITSDGSLNIPKQWGRKARQGKNWLSKLDRNMPTSDDAPANERKARHRGSTPEAVYDWQQEASQTPLPSALEQDSLDHSPSPAPTKLSALAARDRVRKLAFGEEQFLLKTQEEAAARSRNSVLDAIRDREIQNLTKSAVTTSRLGELKEKRSLDRVGDKSAGFNGAHEHTHATRLESKGELKPLPAQSPTQSMNENVESTAGPEQTNKHLILDDGRMNSSRSTVAKPVSGISSQDLSSTRSQDRASTANTDVSSDHVHIKPQDIQTPLPSRSNKSQAYRKTPLVTGAWIDTPLPATRVEPMDSFEAEDSKEVVKQTSAQLDTDHSDTEIKAEIDSEAMKQVLQATAPKLPGSALAAIINRAKEKKAQGVATRGDDTLLLDDSTILSLEQFVASDEDADSSSSEHIEGDKRRLQEKTRPRRRRIETSLHSQSDSESDSDVGLTTKLDRLHTSIKDASSDIGSLQKIIRKLPQKPASTSTSRASSRSRPESECEEAGEFHDFIWPCEKCGHKTGSTIWSENEGSLLDWQWRPLQIYMPQLWYWPENASIPRLTRLGWWSTLCLILAFIELSLHDMYSPPFYAYEMQGYGVDLDAPRPPFVLAKLIWRNVLSSPMEALQVILQVFIRFCTNILGVSPGLFAPPGDVNDPALRDTTWSHRAGSASRAHVDVMGMDADELL